METGIAGDLLDSLSAHIAVLDAQGAIVQVNEAWKSFARENQGGEEASFLGANYLQVCRDAVRRGGDEIPAAVLSGVEAVVRGERQEFSVEYPCHSSTERRWFAARFTRFFHDGIPYIVVVHENTTARKLAEQALEENKSSLMQVLESLPIGVWILNRRGEVVHANPAGQRIWEGVRYVGPSGYGLYKGWWLKSGRRIEAEEWAAFRAIRKGEISLDEEIRIECFDGTNKIILNSALPLQDAAGDIQGAVIVNQDITERHRAEERLRQANAAVDRANRELQKVLEREQLKARTDELTGLGNRRHFLELSHQLVAVALRYRTPLSAIMFDIDNFKRINDLHGHRVGDAVLKRVSRHARENARESDVLARYGGEEFIAMLPNTSAANALAVAEDLRRRIAASPEVVGGREVRVTVSAGVAELRAGEDTLEQLIQRADQALYASKDAGRNCSTVYPMAG